MAGCIEMISSLLLVYIISLNTTYENKEITSQYKGHGQICLTWGGINMFSISALRSVIKNKLTLASLLYFFRFSPEYKYFFNRYVGIVPRVGVLDGEYHDGTNECHSILSLGVGLEWSYNGTGSNSRINNTYYGGSIGVIGLWGVGYGVQVRLTPFKMCKPNWFYMSVDFGALDIIGFGMNDWDWDDIFAPTVCNLAFSIGRSWWI